MSSTSHEEVLAQPAGVRRRVVGDGLSTHDNALNLLRLILASFVLLSHAAGLGGFAHLEGLVNDTSLAQVSLYGFFAISGYLIAQSALRTRPLGYLWRRILRIFPGLVVCCLVVAYVFGVYAFHHEGLNGCGWHCYFFAHRSPQLYVLRNSLLGNPFWAQPKIADTPNFRIDHFGQTWNASIWTLFYEFLCYLLVLVLAMLGMLRQRATVLVFFVMTWATLALFTFSPQMSAQFTLYHWSVQESLLRFTVIFLTGSVLYLYRDLVPDSGWLALASAALFVVGVLLPLDGKFPTFNFTPIDVFLPFLAYPVLWLGLHLPGRGIGSKNDYSYGIYIYGWPVTQMMLMWRFERFGWYVFLPLCLLATIPWAIFSWWVIEKRSLRLKRLSTREAG